MKAPRLLAIGIVLALAASAAAQTKQAPAKRPAAPPKFNQALLSPAALKAQAPETFDVKFATTKGDFVMRVTRAWAPRGADRFYNLVKNGFYDGCAFFRIVPGFVVQFGLSAYPAVSSKWAAAPIPDDPVKASNKRGFVSYAMAGAGTRTTQIFINLADNVRLDGSGFAPLGEVVEGMSVVDQLHSGYGEAPRQDLISARGKTYLESEFPKLDTVKTATVISPPSAPAKAPVKKAP
jgi:peptidyl-prolyl cis-trans isomerase A (cyclophilin A)